MGADAVRAHEARPPTSINTSRGGTVDQEALREALARRARSPAPASTSPTPSRCPRTTRCSSAPNLLVVPHVGSATVRTRSRMADMAVDNLLAALAGEEMPHRAA